MKQYKCKVCHSDYTKQRMGQKVCSPGCAIQFGRDMKEKSRKVLEKAGRIADKAKREALKTRAEWLKEAQSAFNAYIRARDADRPCISCGRHHTGQWHAGHYLSRGARPELAFHPDNCHKQCAPCNTHLSGNLVLYRVNLIQRIGLERVEWLEGPHPTAHLSIDDIKAIRNEYRLKTRQLEKETA